MMGVMSRPTRARSCRTPRGAARVVAALGAVLLTASAPATAAPTAPRTNDPVQAAGLQWALERVGAEAAWGRSQGTGVRIAVVDSGVDLGHPDLDAKVVGHVSCIGASGDPRRCSGPGQDDNGHGTHVAGIAAAETGNAEGIAGVAPDAELLAVRVLANECDATGCTASGTAGDVAAGIYWAVEHGADVINLSLGGGAVQSALGCGFCEAIEYAWSQGVIAVVAAGNDSILPAGFGDTPAVVVTATTRDDQRASYSNRNDSILTEARWPVAAPGGEAEADPNDCSTQGEPAGILSTYLRSLGEGYACLAGTSMAAPHVAGGLALLRQAGLGPQQAIERLLGTAVDLGPSGRDATFGFGRIDLARALDRLSATSVGGPGLAPSTATTAPPGASAPSTTGAAPAPPTTAPPVTTPDTTLAAPFAPTPGPGDDADPGPVPGWLTAAAIAAAAAAALGTSATAWHLSRRT